MLEFFAIGMMSLTFSSAWSRSRSSSHTYSKRAIRMPPTSKTHD